MGVVAVAGYAGAAAALVFKQQAQDNADQVVAALNKARPSFQGCLAPSMVYASSCSAYATDTSNVNDDATAGNVAIGIGLAATAGAIVYWLVADKGEGGATTVRSVVTPVLGPHVGGLAFAATF